MGVAWENGFEVGLDVAFGNRGAVAGHLCSLFLDEAVEEGDEKILPWVMDIIANKGGREAEWWGEHGWEGGGHGLEVCKWWSKLNLVIIWACWTSCMISSGSDGGGMCLKGGATLFCWIYNCFVDIHIDPIDPTPWGEWFGLCVLFFFDKLEVQFMYDTQVLRNSSSSSAELP